MRRGGGYNLSVFINNTVGFSQTDSALFTRGIYFPISSFFRWPDIQVDGFAASAQPMAATMTYSMARPPVDRSAGMMRGVNTRDSSSPANRRQVSGQNRM